MKLYPAKQADIVRCAQRDELFVQQLENDFSYVLRLLGTKYLQHFRSLPAVAANLFYYGLTSASNLQTLGEEYAGILRVTSDNKMPNKLVCNFLFVCPLSSYFILFGSFLHTYDFERLFQIVTILTCNNTAVVGLVWTQNIDRFNFDCGTHMCKSQQRM